MSERTSDVRAAAEQLITTGLPTLIKWIDMEQQSGRWGRPDDVSREVQNDLRLGIKALKQFVDEHPADDAEPIDPDWLKRNSFVDDGGVWKYVCIHLKVAGGHWRLNIGCWWEWLPSESRGDVRLLARALGIELKEPKNA